MNVLIACEESQEVCKAFRAKGHDAYSCDLQEPSGGHPEWHILGDAIPVLLGGEIVTMDGKAHDVGRWDLLIAHPPCTYLCASGSKFFDVGKYGNAAIRRRILREEAFKFFMYFADCGIERIAIENPVGYMSTHYRKPDQIIHPWQFGHPEEKTTCLWLFNLPKLKETDNVREYMLTLPAKERNRLHWLSPSPERAKLRSKTFPGIAKAMADQWG